MTELQDGLYSANRLTTTTADLPSGDRRIRFFGGGTTGVMKRRRTHGDAAVVALLNWVQHMRIHASCSPDEVLERLVRGTSWEHEVDADGELRGIYDYDYRWSSVVSDHVDLSPGALPRWEPPIAFMTPPDEDVDD